jgi:hypothetical protein
LLSHDTAGSDSGRIFSGASQQQSIDDNLQGVFASEKVNDLESVSNNSDGLGFFTGVSAVELKRSDKTLDDGAECLSELLGLVSASSVGYKNLSFD